MTSVPPSSKPQGKDAPREKIVPAGNMPHVLSFLDDKSILALMQTTRAKKEQPANNAAPAPRTDKKTSI